MQVRPRKDVAGMVAASDDQACRRERVRWEGKQHSDKAVRNKSGVDYELEVAGARTFYWFCGEACQRCFPALAWPARTLYAEAWERD